MAQSSSVAREPSMEEILASIRRIIEESDTGPVRMIRCHSPSIPTCLHARLFSSPRRRRSIDEEQLPPREGIAVSQPNSQSYETAHPRPAPSQSKPVERGWCRSSSKAES